MDPEVQARLARLIERIGPGTANGSGGSTLSSLDDDALSTLAQDEAAAAADRLAALRGLLERHRVDRSASTVLQAMLGARDDDVVLATIELVPPFDAVAMDRLAALLEHRSDAIRFAAARALGRRKDRSIAARLVSWLRGDDPEAQRVAVEVMTWILDDREGARVLAAIWERSDLAEPERMRVALRLAALGDTRVIDWLLEEYEGGGERAAAARRGLESLLEGTVEEPHYPHQPEKRGNPG